MPVIKRYPNRKLYNTETKKYITLDEIAHIIREGEEVQVVDYASGEDLTALTLTQIIFEEEKKQSGFLPRSVLAGLIQTGGNRFNALQRTLSSSLSFLHQIDEEIRQRIQALVNQGELTEGEGRNLLEKLVIHNRSATRGAELGGQVSYREVEEILASRQVPSQEDLQLLLKQLDELSAKLDQMANPDTEDDQPST